MYDAQKLEQCGWPASVYGKKYTCGTGFMGAFAKAMALNAGQSLGFWDPPDNCSAGSNQMGTTSSVYDGTSANRLHFTIHTNGHCSKYKKFIKYLSETSCTPRYGVQYVPRYGFKYMEIMRYMRDNGGAPRFIQSEGRQHPERLYSERCRRDCIRKHRIKVDNVGPAIMALHHAISSPYHHLRLCNFPSFSVGTNKEDDKQYGERRMRHENELSLWDDSDRMLEFVQLI